MPDLSGHNIGRYHIIERLGEGGMATVYKAFDTRLERTVAIKFIRKEEVGQSRLALMLKRFEREARALAQLTHPNIVAVIDYGEYEDAPYLVMEYIQSGTLKARTGTPMPYQEAARFLAPIADALRYAHQHNTIHRDVKPANILIDESGHPMLSDFGIAKILGVDETTSLTGTNVGIGTPEYMAPEQWNNKVVPQTDMYSLGVVFYELVTGRKPYTADTPAAIAIKQATEPLKRPKDIIPNLPNEVEAVIFKALARDPLDRYPDMAAFTVALEKLSRGAAVGSAPQKEPIPEKRVYPPSALPAVDKDTTTETPPEVNPPGVASNPWRWVALGLGGLVILIVVVWALLLNKPQPTEPSQEISQMQTSMAELQAGKTQVVAAISPSLQVTAQETILVPKAGATQISEKDGMEMVYVPEGIFFMGSMQSEIDAAAEECGNDCDLSYFNAEMPQHKVYLDGYWMDKTEVTNAMYQKCVEGGTCQKPYSDSSRTHKDYFGNVAYSNYPVINVDWSQAQTYCQWVGGKLPSEAEWEKAARDSDWRKYPWGKDKASCELANYDGKMGSGACVGDTTEVGSYPKGASPYGIMDMAGNVWEWVNDWYDENYYRQSPENNPTGPVNGLERGIRGGYWHLVARDVRSAVRLKFKPDYWNNILGFRCVRNVQLSIKNPTPVTADIMVGLVLSGKLNEGLFNQLAYQGVKKASDENKIKFDYIETNSSDDYMNNVDTFAHKGYNHIVTVGFTMGDTTKAAAEKYPNINFSIVDFAYEQPIKNVQGLVFREDQAGFMAGVIAGQMTKSKKVGSVCGMEIIPVKKFRNGYEAGVKHVCPDCKVIGVYIDSFTDPARGKDAAESQIANGVDVIFGAGGQTSSGGILDAAQQGVWVIGVDQDEYLTTFKNGKEKGSEKILSSAIKRVDVAVYTSILETVNGSFNGGTKVYDANVNGIGLAPFHDADAAVSIEVKNKLDDIYKKLSDGILDTGVDPNTGDKKL